MTKEEARKEIGKIPVNGWWKSSSEQDFNKAFWQLVEHGYEHREAMNLLENLYYAVADEYGN